MIKSESGESEKRVGLMRLIRAAGKRRAWMAIVRIGLNRYSFPPNTNIETSLRQFEAAKCVYSGWMGAELRKEFDLFLLPVAIWEL